VLDGITAAYNATGSLPNFSPKIWESIVLKKGEVVKMASEVVLVVERSQLAYRAGSKGVNVRICKGVTAKIGNTRGTFEREVTDAAVGTGLLLATNQRIIYQPNDAVGHAVQFPISKISGFKPDQNTLRVYKEGRERPYIFRMSKETNVVGAFCFVLEVLTRAAQE